MNVPESTLVGGDAGSGWSLRSLLLLLAGAVTAVVAVVYAYCQSFSSFSSYDDEGFMMISVRGFLEGQPLYSKIWTVYGPFYYFYEWFIHVVLALPLTHDITRATCIVNWLSASTLLAFAGRAITKSALTGFFIFMQATVHLAPLTNEPGHPQEVVVFLMALAALVAAKGLRHNSTLALLAGIGAALLFTKINVGVFFGAALLLAVLCAMPSCRRHTIVFWGVLTLSATMPFILMRPHLENGWARVYSQQIGLSILAAGGVSYSLRCENRVESEQILRALGVFFGISALFVGLSLITGVSLSSMVANLVTASSKMGNSFCIPLAVPYCSWSGAEALIIAGVVVVFRKRLGHWRFLIAAAKGLYGLMGTLLFLNYHSGQLGYLLPWSWLLLVQTEARRPGETGDTFARTFVCMLAVWQGLQAYPVAGTQVAISTFVPILVFSVCFYDGLKTLITWFEAAGYLHGLASFGRGSFHALALASMVSLFAFKWCAPLSCWNYYYSGCPLGLPGAKLLRVPEFRVKRYRALTQYLRTESDTFVTIPGLNSLYFWSGKTPPTYFNVAEAVLLSAEQQARVVSVLQGSRRPLIVAKDGAAPFPAAGGPLADLVLQHCKEVARFGEMRVLEIVETGSVGKLDPTQSLGSAGTPSDQLGGPFSHD